MTEGNLTKEDVRELAKLKRAFKNTFLKTEEGRMVLEELLLWSGFFQPYFKPNGELPYYTALRDFGLKILTALDANSYPGLKQLENEGVSITNFNEMEE